VVVGKSVNVLEVVIRVPSVCVMHTRKESAGRNARSSSGSDPEIPPLVAPALSGVLLLS
jgi:hypothetical protein